MVSCLCNVDPRESLKPYRNYAKDIQALPRRRYPQTHSIERRGNMAQHYRSGAYHQLSHDGAGSYAETAGQPPQIGLPNRTTAFRSVCVPQAAQYSGRKSRTRGFPASCSQRPAPSAGRFGASCSHDGCFNTSPMASVASMYRDCIQMELSSRICAV